MREKAKKRSGKETPTITSSDELNQYLKTANPGIRTILILILIVVAASLAWFFLTSIYKNVTTVGVNEDGVMTLYISEDDALLISEGQDVIVNGTEYRISEIEKADVTGKLKGYKLTNPDGSVDYIKTKNIYVCTIYNEEDDGYYSIDLSVLQGSPFSILFNP